jgi:pimeloyl-ACP methyl ester carboxylesterase
MALKEIEYKNHKFDISYEIVNSSKDKTIVILHGWGSNKEIMKQAFAKELREFKHIYIDMPGFGKSSEGMVLTTDDYAKIIKIFLDTISCKADIAMGHSFGGKVATLLDTPCLVLLSSAGILTEKPWSIKMKIATFKLLKPLGFAKLREIFASADVADMSHEMYETFKNVVDEDFEERFSNSNSKALLFWGREDTATPLYTGEKIDTLIKDSKLYPLDGDHYFFLKYAKFIGDTIMSECKGDL